tara:strand:- start:3848 stop:4222 length:375 start_codon:yes stop_codon:yes gene_type:complete
MLGPGRERPKSTHAISVAAPHRLSPRVEHSDDQRILIGAVDIVLSLLAQEACDPRMNLKNAKTPAGGTAAGGNFLHDIEMGMKVHLPAAAPGRLDDAEKASGPHIRNVFLRQAAERVRFGCTVA